MTQLLGAAALNAWLGRWRGLGVPWVDAWRPGLDAGAIAAAERAWGVVLPPELRTWWGWRDGLGSVVHDGRQIRPAASGDIMVWSLEEAAERTRAYREIVGPDAPPSWVTEERWLHIGGMGNGDMVLADLEPSPEGASEVRRAALGDVNDPPGPSAPSLGTLIAWWTSALDGQVHWWDDEVGIWEVGPELPPEEQRLTGLV